MTVLLYAGRKGWPVESVNVELSHERDHVDDCENCEEPGHMIETIRRYILVKGSLDVSQQQRILEVAKRCPSTRPWPADHEWGMNWMWRAS